MAFENDYMEDQWQITQFTDMGGGGEVAVYELRPYGLFIALHNKQTVVSELLYTVFK